MVSFYVLHTCIIVSYLRVFYWFSLWPWSAQYPSLTLALSLMMMVERNARLNVKHQRFRPFDFLLAFWRAYSTMEISFFCKYLCKQMTAKATVWQCWVPHFIFIDWNADRRTEYPFYCRTKVYHKAGNQPKWSRHKRLDQIAPMNLNAIGNQVHLLMNNGVKM